ncbi:MAG: hypothetical protein Q8O00_12160 [Holophaga sp.]|nr:hypothetical protein [Holophaga sp.]
MRKVMLLLVLGTGLWAQGAGQHFGLNIYGTKPTDEASKLYDHGWKIAVPFYFRIGNPVEQRLRVEFGKFSKGRPVAVAGGWEQSEASTRLVGYDWLISLGQRKEAGVDLILGIGGARWNQNYVFTHAAGSGLPDYEDTDQNAAFAATIGFRFRFTRNLALELHQVLTSLPGSDRDFKDAELSHTALGLAFRF